MRARCRKLVAFLLTIILIFGVMGQPSDVQAATTDYDLLTGKPIASLTDIWRAGYLDQEGLSGNIIFGDDYPSGYYLSFQTIEDPTVSGPQLRIMGCTLGRCSNGVSQDDTTANQITIPLTNDRGEYAAAESDFIYTMETQGHYTIHRWYIPYSWVLERVRAISITWADSLDSGTDQRAFVIFNAIAATLSGNDASTLSGQLVSYPVGSGMDYLGTGELYCRSASENNGKPASVSGAVFHDLSEAGSIVPGKASTIPLLTDQVCEVVKDKQYSKRTSPDLSEGSSDFEDEHYLTYYTEKTGDSLASMPTLYAYNDSRAYVDGVGASHTWYDLSKGIPGKERVINGYIASAGYGKVEIGRRYVTKKYPITYTYHNYVYLPREYLVHVVSSNGMETVSSVTVPDIVDKLDHTEDLDIYRRAYYYYIRDLDYYEFAYGNVHNHAFVNGNLNYQNTSMHRMLDSEGYSITSGMPYCAVTINGQRGDRTSPITITSWEPDDSKHIKWKAVSINEIDLGFASQKAARYGAIKWADKQIPQKGFATVSNDYLNLGGHVVLDGSTVDAENEDGDYRSTDYLKQPSWPSYSYGFNAMQFEKDVPFGMVPETINAMAANGTYNTAIGAIGDDGNLRDGGVYKKILTKGNETQTKALSFIKPDTMAVTDRITGLPTDRLHSPADANESSAKAHGGYLENEPIKVHSPVIAPVNIFTENGDKPIESRDAGKTQLINPTGGSVSGDTSYQLRLDTRYKFKFVARSHMIEQGYMESDRIDNAWNETDNKYDKYVKAKYVHFPFTVLIADDTGKLTNILRPVEDETDPEYWHMLSKLDEATFYIPPWAAEGEHTIRYKVEAQNVHDQDSADHTGATEPEYNITPDNYVATYNIHVSLSGWLYDLEVDGINDADTFARRSDKDAGGSFQTTWYSFAKNKQELKQGRLNRTASENVHYTLDGTLMSPVDKILPFGNGSATEHNKGEGTLRCGNQLFFTLKTMTNPLSDDNVRIKPSYRYISPDGKDISKTVKIYYKDRDGKIYPIDKGTDVYDVHIGMPGFAGTYAPDQIEFNSIQRYGDATMSSKILGYRSKLDNSLPILRETLKLFSGKPSDITSLSGETEDNIETFRKLIAFLTETDYESLKKSVQTWYGSYRIPEEIYVTDYTGDISDYVRDKNGIGADDEIWLKDGYLMLSFECFLYHGDEPYLAYASPSDGSKQWERQAPAERAVAGDAKDSRHPLIQIVADTGDIGVIDITKKVTDRYRSGIYAIN